MTRFDRPATRPRRRAVPARRPYGTRTHGTAGAARHPALLRIWLPAAAVLALIGGYALALRDPAPAPTRHVVWVAEKTTSTAAGVPDRLRQHLLELIGNGPVQLTTYAVGQTAYRVGSMDLLATRDGEPEFDPGLRAAGLRDRLATVSSGIERAPVGGQGFSLYAALQAITTEPPPAAGPLEVWLSTAVLTGSVEPLAMPELTAADPQPMVDELVARSLAALRLDDVELHPVLLTPVGEGQEPLTPATDAWRSTFIRALGTGLGATVDEPNVDLSTASPWARSSVTPPVTPLRDPPPEPPKAAGPAPVYVLDTVAFMPDQAALIDRDATLAKVDTIAAAFQPGMRVDVVGYCAAFGQAHAAQVLSAQRAAVIGELLRTKGVPETAITTEGRGFDERANPNEPPRSAAQRVVLVKLQPAG